MALLTTQNLSQQISIVLSELGYEMKYNTLGTALEMLLPNQAVTFLYCVVLDDEQASQSRQTRQLKTSILQIECEHIKKFQFEVDAIVRKVVVMEDSHHVDGNASLMDEGLDSLGRRELSEMLQS